MFSSLLGLSRSFWTASCTVVLFLPIIVRIETRPLRFMVLLWITYFGSYRFDGWPLCFIFSQISDIHISVYVDPGRYEDLKLFIKQVVGTVKPAVVFVTGLSLSLPPLSFPLHLSPSPFISLSLSRTGDITDAKGADQLSSTQESKEWHIYRDILNQSQFGDMPWIDLRGNHG